MISISIHKKLWSASGEMDLDINLEIDPGQLVAITGRSGAGKSSLLRIISGLMSPDTGLISIDTDVWFDSGRKIDISPQQRNVGLVFQDYALFPHLTVRENLIFALKDRKNDELIDPLIQITELGELINRMPDTLSGGQKQRVALARSLVQRPQLLLLDEPLSALDAQMRTSLQQFILDMHKRYELTTILVSHDTAEVIRMADYVVELEEGKVTKKGDTNYFYNSDHVSGKFQFVGDIISITQQDVVYVITVMIGKRPC